MSRESRRSRAGWAYALVIVAGFALAGLAAHAQPGTPFNERDDQYRLLGLKRAKEAFEIAETQFRRQQELYDAGLVADSGLDEARRVLSEAEVNYQQSILAVLFEQQYVAVMGAIKYQNGDGRKHVRLEIENTSRGGAELAHLANLDDAVFRSLQPDVVHDVYVSLANDDGAIISQPYEAKLEELRYGRPRTLDFALLQDLDAVTVQLTYGKSAQRTVKIFLQKDQTVDQVAVQSEQFSQEADLGSQASFDLTLELFSGRTDAYKLEVVGLPPEIRRHFVDPASGARLSNFKFTESTQTRSAALEIFLPDRTSDAVRIDEPLPFWVLVIPRHRLDELDDLVDRDWTAAAVAELGLGSARLELLPRGVGRLRVKVPILYFPTDPGQAVEVTLEVINEGTRRLDNVELAVDPPLRWAKSVDPPLVERLEVGEEKAVQLFLEPPADAVTGKYETRVRTTSFSENQPIEAEDKIVTVEIRPAVRVAPSIVLMLILVALVLAVVIFGVRLARR